MLWIQNCDYQYSIPTCNKQTQAVWSGKCNTAATQSTPTTYDFFFLGQPPQCWPNRCRVFAYPFVSLPCSVVVPFKAIISIRCCSEAVTYFGNLCRQLSKLLTVVCIETDFSVWFWLYKQQENIQVMQLPFGKRTLDLCTDQCWHDKFYPVGMLSFTHLPSLPHLVQTHSSTRAHMQHRESPVTSSTKLFSGCRCFGNRM